VPKILKDREREPIKNKVFGKIFKTLKLRKIIKKE
jgi:hypothetical protein